MQVPILSRRRERKQAELQSAIEKALTPALAAAAQSPSGASYPVVGQNPLASTSSPFYQTAGNVNGYEPLPRPTDQFGSLFGPGTPLWSDPLDPIESYGRAQPRRSQYEVSWNLQLADRRTPWSTLYQVAEACDVVNRAIMIQQDELCGFEWTWGFSKQVIQQIMESTGETNSAKANAIAQTKYGDELTRVQQFFERPDRRMGFTFSQFLSEAIWNHLTFDGVCIYPQYNLGGELISLSNLDPSTIKVLRDNQGFVPLPPAPGYQQILYGFPRGEFQAEDPDSDAVSAEFVHDQLGYYVRRPTPRSVYGFSVVEEVLPLARIYMNRQAWWIAEYTHGVTPRLMMELADTETWTPEQLAYAENVWNDRLSGQTQRRQMAFFLRPGMVPHQMESVDELYKADYDNYIVGQIASRFGIPATQLGVQAKAGLSGGKQMEGESNQSTQYSTAAMVAFFIDCLNDMARRFMGVGPEITALCNMNGSGDENDINAINADVALINAGVITRNEERAKRGYAVMNEPEADSLGVTTGTGVTFLAGELAVQQETQQASIVGAQNAQQATPGETDLQGQPANQAPPQNGKTPVQNNAKTSSNNGNSKTSAKDDTRQPSASNSDGDDSRQPDAQKELAAFARFAKARYAREQGWRNFEFTTLPPFDAVRLNELGASGDLDAIAKATKLVAAGICVKANDTGRVLLVQRSIDNKSKAAGQWEWPGGKLGSDTPKDAAIREFQEETGIELPDGKFIGSWTTLNGYQCFVYLIDHESDISTDDLRTSLDGGGDKEIENVAWWDPNDLQANPAVRTELQSSDWSLIGSAKKSVDEEIVEPVEAEETESQILSADELAAMVKDRLAPDMAQLIESAKRIDDVKARFEHSELLAALGRPVAPVQPIVHVYNEPPEIRVPDVHVNVDAPDFSKAKAPVVQVTPEINVNIPEQPAPQISFTPEIHVDAAQVNIPAPIVNVDVAAPEVTITPEINVASPTIKIPKADPPNVTVQVPAAPQPRKMTAYKRSTGEIVVEATPETK